MVAINFSHHFLFISTLFFNFALTNRKIVFHYSSQAILPQMFIHGLVAQLVRATDS